MNLFEYAVANYSVYPTILGFNYLDQVKSTPGLVDELNSYEFVFVSSDYGVPIEGCDAIQMLTGADFSDSTKTTWMWTFVNCDSFKPLPYSEYTEVPSVGFVGRIPMLKGQDGYTRIHRGFSERFHAIEALCKSDSICVDFHPHTTPDGDSAGFWNASRPDARKNGPLFKNNMLANQYQLCARGNGNYAQRLFETLAYGRIPVFIDTDCKWPLYGGHTADIEENLGGLPFPVVYDLEDAEKTVLEFHEQFRNSEDVWDCQRDCRDFYDEHFSQISQIREFDYLFGDYKLVKS
jgi:hypothetical protein